MISPPHPSGFPASVSCPSRLPGDLPGAASQRPAEQPASRRSRASKGLTLIEVLVALAFLAVFAAGIMGLAIAVLKGNTKSQSTDTAVYLALDKLETIRNTAYSGVAAGSVTENYGSISVATVAYPDFQRTTDVFDNTPKTGMKRVVVTVLSRRGSNVRQEMIIGQ